MSTPELTTVNGKQYLIVNDTYFHRDTPIEVAGVLLNAMADHTRIRVDYGDIVTGKSRGEEHDIEGYVGRSLGPIKIPLLIYNYRSHGGTAILDNCIVGIKKTRGGEILYEHPTYSPVHS